MLRLVGGAIAGIIGWTVLVTVLNFAMRHGWPAYAAVEKAMAFTIPMMIARLGMSAVASLASGFLATRIGKSALAALIAGVVAFLMFLAVHYSLWERFPAWYHLAFLASLPLLGWLGGRWAQARTPAI